MRCPFCRNSSDATARASHYKAHWLEFNDDNEFGDHGVGPFSPDQVGDDWLATTHRLVVQAVIQAGSSSVCVKTFTPTENQHLTIHPPPPNRLLMAPAWRYVLAALPVALPGRAAQDAENNLRDDPSRIAAFMSACSLVGLRVDRAPDIAAHALLQRRLGVDDTAMEPVSAGYILGALSTLLSSGIVDAAAADIDANPDPSGFSPLKRKSRLDTAYLDQKFGR